MGVVTSPKTIVLWGNDDMLSSYVEVLLTTQNGWEVVNLPIERTLGEVLRTIDMTNPEIVIIQQGDRNCDSAAPAILMQSCPNLQVLTLSLTSNIMEVYSKQDILIKSAVDFISIIEAI